MSNTMSGPGRPHEYQGWLGEFVDIAGGVVNFARSCGLSPRTIQRRARKMNFTMAEMVMLNNFAKANGLKKPFDIAL